MPCRVGIGTDPNERKNYWKNKVHSMEGFEILGKFNTKAKAQRFETQYAKDHSCIYSPGGRDAPDPWYAYRFDYTRVKKKK